MTHTVHHLHQHRLDRKHNVLLLLIPGLIFVSILAIYLILRSQTGHPVAAVSTPLDNSSTSY